MTTDLGSAELDAVTSPALAALLELMLALEDSTENTADLALHPCVAARRSPQMRKSVVLAEEVARSLVAYLTGRGTADAVEQAAARLGAELRLGEVIRGRPEWYFAADPAQTLIRDVALESFGLNVELLVPADPEGPPFAFAWHPAETAYARAWLMDAVLQDCALAMADDALVRLELRAAGWWFDRWTPALPADEAPPAFAGVARRMRRREWCVAGRATVAHREPVVATCLRRRRLTQVSPLRREIAGSLSGSQASLYVIRARADERTVVEESISGETLHVHDHRPDLPYPAGCFALGRLAPLADGTCMRSPAMKFYQHEDPEVMDGLKAEFRARVSEHGCEIAIEMLLSAMSGDRDVPRTIPPAGSAEEAQELMNEVWQLLKSRLGGKPRADGRTQRLVGPLPPGYEARQFMLDRTLSEWMGALDAQVRGEEP